MKYLLLTYLLCFSSVISAKLLRSDASITALYGTHYQVGDATRAVMTLEHSSGFSWGDNFFFLDRLWGENGNHSTYFELSPRFNLRDYENAWLKGIKLATTWEHGKHFDHKLIGLGTNFKVPGFNFVGLNLYRRFNDGNPDAWQSTLNWRRPFAIGKQQWVYDGFIDWTSRSQAQASSFNFTSQLKWNIAPLLGLSKPFYLGSEIIYWNNKFGIADINERNLNLLIKAHF